MTQKDTIRIMESEGIRRIPFEEICERYPEHGVDGLIAVDPDGNYMELEDDGIAWADIDLGDDVFTPDDMKAMLDSGWWLGIPTGPREKEPYTGLLDSIPMIGPDEALPFQ